MMRIKRRRGASEPQQVPVIPPPPPPPLPTLSSPITQIDSVPHESDRAYGEEFRDALVSSCEYSKVQPIENVATTCPIVKRNEAEPRQLPCTIQDILTDNDQLVAFEDKCPWAREVDYDAWAMSVACALLQDDGFDVNYSELKRIGHEQRRRSHKKAQPIAEADVIKSLASRGPQLRNNWRSQLLEDTVSAEDPEDIIRDVAKKRKGSVNHVIKGVLTRHIGPIPEDLMREIREELAVCLEDY